MEAAHIQPEPSPSRAAHLNRVMSAAAVSPNRPRPSASRRCLKWGGWSQCVSVKADRAGMEQAWGTMGMTYDCFDPPCKKRQPVGP